VATLGHGTILELPSKRHLRKSSTDRPDGAVLARTLVSFPARSRSWHRTSGSQVHLVEGTARDRRKFTSSKGLLGIAGRTPSKRSYTPYQRPGGE
jgi:hypothetical protein